MDDVHLRCMSYAHRYLRSKFFYAMCSLKRTSAKYVPKGDTSKMYRIAHRIREANFSCDVLLTVQNGCAVNEKDLKC